MRILLLTSLFDPEHAIKGQSFAVGLLSYGHKVQVITTFPNYPSGEIFPGYRMRLKQLEHIEGVEIVRLPTFINHSSSALQRVVSYASFGFVASFYATFFAPKPDVIYAYHPPIAVGFAAWLVGKIRRSPFVFDVQDLWPDALIATGMARKGLATRLITKLANFIYSQASRVIVISNGYREALIARGVPAEKVVHIYNWSDDVRQSDFTVAKANLVQEKNLAFKLVYAGNFGKAQSLSYVLDAAYELQRRNINNIYVEFVGSGVEEELLREKAAKLNLKNVVFHARVAPEKIASILRAADAVLAHLADEWVFSITIPSKIQAYLAAGRPILAAVGGETAELVVSADVGEVAIPCNSISIADAIVRLAARSDEELKEMGVRAFTYYQEKFSQKVGIEKTVQVLKMVVGGGK